MDSYQTDKNLRDANSFFVNFNFEVLFGCTHSCKGCYVERYKQNGIEREDILKFHSLLDDFDNSLYKPFIAFIGPTDFMVSDNTLEWLADPDIVKMLNKFKRLSFLTTYLDVSKQQQLADILNTYYSDLEMEINILLEPEKINDEQYILAIQRNQIGFEGLLNHSEIRRFALFNTYSYDKSNMASLLTDYHSMHNKIGHLFDTTIDFNFGFGRRTVTSKKDFEDHVEAVSNCFDGSVNKETASYIRFSFGKLTDSLVERQYNYRNGQFFYAPLLYERFVGFSKELQIPVKDWKAIEFENYEENIQISQYTNASDKECASCPYIASCIDRGILKLMDVYSIKDCVLAKKALDIVNQGEL